MARKKMKVHSDPTVDLYDDCNRSPIGSSSLFMDFPECVVGPPSSSDEEGPTRRRKARSSDGESDLRDQSIHVAEDALTYYNRKLRTDYELVDYMKSNGRLWDDVIVIHSNFKAKPKSQDDGSSTKLFFAEVEVRASRFRVTACRILGDADGDGDGVKTTLSCDMCKGVFLHPTRGFCHGLYKGEVRDFRPRYLLRNPNP